MQAVTGVFSNQTQAEQAVSKLRSSGIRPDRITLLTPGARQESALKSVPVDTAGRSAGLVAAAIPGVGLVTAMGLLGAAVLTAAGAGVGAVTGRALENESSQGLPEDEIFVYEDALRKGRSVVIALAEDQGEIDRVREELKSRSAEEEHYLQSGRGFGENEKFYRKGFEAALHAKNRCKEFDQVSSEMSRDIEDLEREHPGAEVADAFTQGYQRGRDYYERMCDKTKAA